MPNREEIHTCVEKLLYPTANLTSGLVTSGAALDTLGFDSAHFNIALGAGTGGTGPVASGVEIWHSDDNVTFTLAGNGEGDDTVYPDVVADGVAPAASSTLRIAYVGNKRYAKAIVTGGVLGTFPLTITGHLGYASQKPPANPA